jgi:hypothetical protein
MISSGPLAGGHLQSEQGEMQGKMGIWVPVVLLLMIVLFRGLFDHEREHSTITRGAGPDARLCFGGRPL